MYDGLSVYHRGVVSRVTGYPGRGVFSLAQDARGDLLVGGGDGLYRYSGGKFKAVDLGLPPGEVAKIRTLIPAGDGTLWMTASGRLYHISATGARVYEAINARFGQPIMCIYVDTGRVWAGTYGGGLFLLKADSLYQIRPRGAEIGPRILGIHEDAAGFLWINAERELQRVRKEELLKASADPDATVRIWVYDHQDGLSNLDFSYVSSSSSQQLPNGYILYASTNGIVVVDTRSEPSRHAPPPVYVEDIVADGVAYPAIEGPVLPPGTRRVEIRFTALQYDVPRRVRFRVKAAELDHDWVALDGLSRSVVYTSPPPGRYTFTVLASTASTEEGWTGTQASFAVAPYIYETWWFRWGGAFIAVGLLLTGYLARMRTMRRRQAALAAEVAQRRHAEEQLRASLDEKTVMLKEIHHRVKNNLQIISSLLNLQAGMHHDEQLRHELKESQQRIRTMALIHERLYKSGNLARIGFREYVDTLVQQLGHSMGTERILCRVEGDEIMLSIGQAIPAALIVNELVTNSLKHAFPAGRSGRVVVRVTDLGECRTEFSVQDDGCGLPPGFDMQRVETLGMQLVTTLVTQLEGELTVGGTAGALLKIRFTRD
jgi:two-component sensor histidine kinase